jgi:hypothetical protein
VYTPSNFDTPLNNISSTYPGHSFFSQDKARIIRMESIDLNTHAVAAETSRVEALDWVVIPSIVLLVCLSTTSFVPDIKANHKNRHLPSLEL